jgi:pyruvate kinase
MPFAPHKTKIVCTIGPASRSPAVIEQLLHAGMSVARLNLSHDDFSTHKAVIENLRAAARAVGKRVAIMADLPGPKMRLGRFSREPIFLKSGDVFTLTTNDIRGDGTRVSVTFARLPVVVKPGDTLFLNDGVVHLEVTGVMGNDVHCRVVAGGELRSRKGLNLPGIDLGISAFTDRDHECLRFALENGVDAVSQSFVERATDIDAVRAAATALGRRPFILAKIERVGALAHLDEIVRAADGVMIARGDLGVEIPIEQMAVVQKQIMRKANLLGKPVITATQMLESMVEQTRPTRAEATDVANAILDGTDCVMLSAESAMGKNPLEAVTMLAKIAMATEGQHPHSASWEALSKSSPDKTPSLPDLIALSVRNVMEHISPAVVVVPTASGRTARLVSRFKLPVWITAVSPEEATCQHLQFSYGVHPLYVSERPRDWNTFTRDWLRANGVTGHMAVLTEGPSPDNPFTNNRMELIELGRSDSGAAGAGI